MEAVEESLRKARVENSSRVPEPGKYQDSDGKTLEVEAQTLLGALDQSSQENGVRVSVNEGGGSGGRLGETRILAGNDGVPGVESEDLEDSEMNGVSSLLKMREHSERDGPNRVAAHGKESIFLSDENLGGNPYGDTRNVNDNGEEEEEEASADEEHGFHVGDFVWGKIRSHPWWPGQIYDPTYASDLALKITQKGRLLVAYFGDGTFAWCHHSQLKPFFEGFEEKSKVSNSRGFVNAVMEAVEEIGRHVEIGMTCFCVKKELLSGLMAPPAVNSGIKEGTVVPTYRNEVISSFGFEPEMILSDVKELACYGMVSDLLSYQILKRQLSAFYRAKGYLLPEFDEPETIIGLEDDNCINLAVKLRGYESSTEEHTGKGSSEKGHGGLVKCSGFPEDRMSRRRKQKSLSEIMEAEVDSRAEDEGASVQGKKKTKRPDDSGKDQVNPGKRKRKMTGEPSESGTTGESSERISESGKTKNKNSKEETDESSLSELRRKLKIEIPSVAKDNCDTKEQSGTESLSRERKRSKYLSPPYTTDFSRKSKRSDPEAEPITVSDQSGKEALEKKVTEDTGEQHKTEDAPGYKTPRGGKGKAITQSNTGEPVDKLLSGIRSLALRPQYVNENSFVGPVREFVFAHRNMTFHNISKDEMYKKPQSEKKRKRGTPEPQSISSSQNQSAKSRKREARKPEQDVEDQNQNAKSQKKERKKLDQDLGAELLATFDPGSDLPKKDDIVNIYSKYGSLDKEKSDIVPQNSCARILFTRVSDAEEAFNISRNMSPFGSSKVTFRLRYLSLEQDLVAPPTKNQGRRKGSKPSTDASSQINYMKNKLESMRSMLETSDGRMSVELKSKLEIEMKDMLEKLSTAAVSSS